MKDNGLIRTAGLQCQSSVRKQFLNEGCVVDDFVTPPVVGIFVLERVEAMRALSDDATETNFVQRLDVLLCLPHEGKVVSQPARGVAGAGFSIAENRKVHRRGLEDLRQRPSYLL